MGMFLQRCQRLLPPSQSPGAQPCLLCLVPGKEFAALLEPHGFIHQTFPGVTEPWLGLPSPAPWSLHCPESTMAPNPSVCRRWRSSGFISEQGVRIKPELCAAVEPWQLCRVQSRVWASALVATALPMVRDTTIRKCY